MGRFIRTRRCACGSGKAARDCCGRFARVSEAQLARAHLRRLARPAREQLAPFSSTAAGALHAEAVALPGARPELAAALAHVRGAPLGRLVTAVARRPESDVERFVAAVVARRDFPTARAAVARAVVGLREANVIDDYVAASALVDLDRPDSAVLAATVSTAARNAATAGPAAQSGAGRVSASATATART